MFCMSCGNPQPSAATFCPNCGTKYPEVNQRQTPAEPTTATPNSSARPIQQNATPIEADLPVGDLEPIFMFEGTNWTFRHKDKAKPPPAWTRSPLDFMISEDFIVFQSTTDINTLGETLKGVGMMAAMVAGAAVPIVGLTAAAITWGTASALDPRKKKHAGYGKHNQLTSEALILRFIAGESVWVKKKECEFRALRSRYFMDTYHYFAVIGKFHHISGIFDLAVFKDVHNLYGADFKRDVAKRGDCIISRDDKYSVRSEVLRSIEGYSEPPITNEFDANKNWGLF